MELLTNFPLLSSLAAIIFAQVIKVPIQFIVSRKLDWSLVTSTGACRALTPQRSLRFLQA